jgi:xanthine dehydrogenase accessory factor
MNFRFFLSEFLKVWENYKVGNMLLAIIRGGGDLASGIAVRLYRSGIKVVITEIQQPLAVRRNVSFAEAVYSKSTAVEEIKGVFFSSINGINHRILNECIPVIVDPELSISKNLNPQVIIDARMRKTKSEKWASNKQKVIGIGPGFVAGKNCVCVIETKRGPYLGRVYREGAAEPDSGIPDRVGNFANERVLRSPSYGVFKATSQISDILEVGDEIGFVGMQPVIAPFKGLLRGLIHDGLNVDKGMKIGDLDPRCDLWLCNLVSDKALSIGGGVLEAILAKESFRKQLIS